MFGIFKKPAVDQDTVLVAGITAGISFRSIEKKHGTVPVSETPAVLDACKRAACEMMSINPDENSRQVLHMVALVFSMDDSGLAERITNRYQAGDTTIRESEAQQIWDLTLRKTQETFTALSKGSRNS